MGAPCVPRTGGSAFARAGGPSPAPTPTAPRRLGPVRAAQAAGHRPAVVHVHTRSQPPLRRPTRAVAASAVTPAAPTLADLGALLAKADDPGTPPAAVDAAELEAVALAGQLKAAGVLRGYGGAARTPKRDYSLAELRLNYIEPAALLSPVDATLGGVRRTLGAAAAVGGAAAVAALHLSFGQVVGLATAGLFAVTADQARGSKGTRGGLLVVGQGWLVDGWVVCPAARRQTSPLTPRHTR